MTAWIVPLDVDSGTDANEVSGGSGAVDGAAAVPPGGSAAAAPEKISATAVPLSTAARSAARAARWKRLAMTSSLGEFSPVARDRLRALEGPRPGRATRHGSRSSD